MGLSFVVGILALIMVFVAPLLLLLGCCSHNSTHNSTEEQIRRNRSIADFSFFDASSLSDRLRLRAGPNSRLINALGIYNSLTTSDKAVHKTFLKRAVRAIKRANGPVWQHACILASDTIGTIKAQLYDTEQNRLNLERTVRILCLDAVLELFFPYSRARPIDIGIADEVTSIINSLWLESKVKKQDEARNTPQKRKLDRLHEQLDYLIPGQSEVALNIIVPAYETLWRVVLLTYVHVAFRHLDDETKRMIYDIVENVTHGDIGAPLDASVDNFSKEALRLYPPTKRIYRASGGTQVATDVEALHHDEKIWGCDALHFRPSRFMALSRNQLDAYMPFGVGSHMCPAANGFGRKMIAILVTTLIARLGTMESGCRIWYGDEVLDGDDAVPLPTRRDDMSSWFLINGPESR